MRRTGKELRRPHSPSYGGKEQRRAQRPSTDAAPIKCRSVGFAGCQQSVDHAECAPRAAMRRTGKELRRPHSPSYGGKEQRRAQRPSTDAAPIKCRSVGFAGCQQSVDHAECAPRAAMRRTGKELRRPHSLALCGQGATQSAAAQHGCSAARMPLGVIHGLLKEVPNAGMRPGSLHRNRGSVRAPAGPSLRRRCQWCGTGGCGRSRGSE